MLRRSNPLPGSFFMFSLIAALVSYRRQTAVSARIVSPTKAARNVANDRNGARDFARAA
jgi:hypothetical protein